MQLMVAATLVLLCSRPVEVSMFGQVPWLLAVPSIAIIGREVIYLLYFFFQKLFSHYTYRLVWWVLEWFILEALEGIHKEFQMSS